MANESAPSTAAANREAALFCVRAAAGMAAEGRMAEARAFLNLAARRDLEFLKLILPRVPPQVRTLAAEIAVLHGPRGGEIGRPCALLGNAEASLGPAADSLIRAIFDHHQREFAAGTTAEPRLAAIYTRGGDVRPDPDRPVRLLLVMEPHVNSNPLFVESDYPYHFSRSAAHAGLSVRVFDAATPLLYDRPERHPFTAEEIAGALHRLEGEVAEFAPDVILIEANFLPTPRTLDPGWLEGLRARRGCKVVALVGDCYDDIPDFFRIWGAVSDLVVLFNEETTYPVRSGFGEKAFLACPLPFDETLLAATEDDKTLDMVLVGTRHRSRDDLAMMLETHGVPLLARLHFRLAAEAPSIAEYADLMRRARLTLNTGRVEPNRSLTILTGRCIEAIAARTVLLEEVGSAIDDYFLPFVHYVPYANAHQLVMFSQFLLKHDDYRRRMAEQAFAWYQSRYTSDRFWGTLLQRLDLPVVPAR